MKWRTIGILAGLAAVALGWLLTTGLVMVAWFTAMAMPLPRVLGFAAQLWLAGHGAGAGCKRRDNFFASRRADSPDPD